jgi:hypothetical protein
VPWTHCDAELTDDVAECPTCGSPKANWTVAVNVTRTLVVSLPKRRKKKTAWLAVRVQRDDGARLAGVRYRVVLPDGLGREGTLDAEGQLRIDDLYSGECVVTFTELQAHGWRLPTLEESVAPGTPSRADDPGGAASWLTTPALEDSKLWVLTLAAPPIAVTSEVDPPAALSFEVEQDEPPPAPRFEVEHDDDLPPAPRFTIDEEDAAPGPPRFEVEHVEAEPALRVRTTVER